MNIQDRIIPVPQKIELNKEKLFTVGSKGYALLADLPDEMLCKNALKRLEACLEELFGAKTEGGYPFRLSMGTAPEGISNPDQGYSLKMDEKGAELVGFGQRGLFYGVTTLLQLFAKETAPVSLPTLEILDYPDMEKRGHFVETRYGTDLMKLEDWKQVIDSLVQQKQNHLTVSLYGCWQVQFDNRVSEFIFAWFDGYEDLKTPVFKKYFSPKENKWINEQVWTPMAEEDFFGKLRAYGRENGVEVIPMFNSLGHNTLIPRLYPEISAVAEDGSLSGVGFCVNNPKTYELLFNIYDQILTRYGKDDPIKSFDIGLDEVSGGRAYIADDLGTFRSPICHCEKCSKMTPREQLFSHAVKLATFLKSRGVETVYMYNDMVCEHRMGRNNHSPADCTYQFRKILVKNDLLDTLCLDWWEYGNIPHMWHLYSFHTNSGIRRTAKPWNGYQHWNFLAHTAPNTYHMCKMAKRDEAEGIRSYSSWDNSYHRNNQMQADWAWNFDGTGSIPEEKARYVRRYFGEATEDAAHAFTLMEEITRTTDTDDPNNTLINRNQLLTSPLCFYLYPYYKHGCEYPRNYPGEMVPDLREHPEKVAEMKIMIAEAEEAQTLWAKVAEACKDPERRALALRYKYDTGTYEMLCRDGVTLMEMDTLAQSYNEKPDPAILKQIHDLAADQYRRRRAHLALLENTKEHYIIPVQGRVSSAPMQYFGDVAAYIENTPAESLKLDFTDMRHANCEEFFNLR